MNECMNERGTIPACDRRTDRQTRRCLDPQAELWGPLSAGLASWWLASRRNLTISNTAGARFGQNLFLDHRTIRLMKLLASTMLSAAIEAEQFSASFVTSLLASFWRNLRKGNKFCFCFRPGIAGNTNYKKALLTTVTRGSSACMKALS